MALVKRRMSRKKQLLILGLLGIAVLAAVGYYILGARDTGVAGPAADPVTQRLQSELKDLNSVQQNLLPTLEQLFEDARFQDLKQYGDVPVTIEPGTVGRQNPFQPL